MLLRLSARSVSQNLREIESETKFEFNFIGSENQKIGTERVIRHLIENKPAQWSQLQKKYDPENIYYTKFKAEAQARGIKV